MIFRFHRNILQAISPDEKFKRAIVSAVVQLPHDSACTDEPIAKVDSIYVK